MRTPRPENAGTERHKRFAEQEDDKLQNDGVLDVRVQEHEQEHDGGQPTELASLRAQRFGKILYEARSGGDNLQQGRGRRTRIEFFEDVLLYEEETVEMPCRSELGLKLASGLHLPTELHREAVPRREIIGVAEVSRSKPPPGTVLRSSPWLAPILVPFGVCVILQGSFVPTVLGVFSLGMAAFMFLWPFFLYKQMRVHLQLPRKEAPGVWGDIERSFEAKVGVPLRGPRIFSMTAGDDFDQDFLLEYVYREDLRGTDSRNLPLCIALGNASTDDHTDPAKHYPVAQDQAGVLSALMQHMESTYESRLLRRHVDLKFYLDVITIQETTRLACYPEIYRSRAVPKAQLQDVQLCKARRPKWAPKCILVLVLLILVAFGVEHRVNVFAVMLFIPLLVLVAWPCCTNQYLIIFDMLEDISCGKAQSIKIATSEKLDYEFITWYVFSSRETLKASCSAMCSWHTKALDSERDSMYSSFGTPEGVDAYGDGAVAPAKCYVFTHEGVKAWAEQSFQHYQDAGSPPAGAPLTDVLLEMLAENGATIAHLLELNFIEEAPPIESKRCRRRWSKEVLASFSGDQSFVPCSASTASVVTDPLQGFVDDMALVISTTEASPQDSCRLHVRLDDSPLLRPRSLEADFDSAKSSSKSTGVAEDDSENSFEDVDYGQKGKPLEVNGQTFVFTREGVAALKDSGASIDKPAVGDALTSEMASHLASDGGSLEQLLALGFVKPARPVASCLRSPTSGKTVKKKKRNGHVKQSRAQQSSKVLPRLPPADDAKRSKSRQQRAGLDSSLVHATATPNVVEEACLEQRESQCDAWGPGCHVGPRDGATLQDDFATEVREGEPDWQRPEVPERIPVALPTDTPVNGGLVGDFCGAREAVRAAANAWISQGSSVDDVRCQPAQPSRAGLEAASSTSRAVSPAASSGLQGSAFMSESKNLTASQSGSSPEANNLEMGAVQPTETAVTERHPLSCSFDELPALAQPQPNSVTLLSHVPADQEASPEPIAPHAVAATVHLKERLLDDGCAPGLDSPSTISPPPSPPIRSPLLNTRGLRPSSLEVATQRDSQTPSPAFGASSSSSATNAGVDTGLCKDGGPQGDVPIAWTEIASDAHGTEPLGSLVSRSTDAAVGDEENITSGARDAIHVEDELAAARPAPTVMIRVSDVDAGTIRTISPEPPEKQASPTNAANPDGGQASVEIPTPIDPHSDPRVDPVSASPADNSVEMDSVATRPIVRKTARKLSRKQSAEEVVPSNDGSIKGTGNGLSAESSSDSPGVLVKPRFCFTAEGVSAFMESSAEDYALAGSPKVGDTLSDEVASALADRGATIDAMLELGFVERMLPRSKHAAKKVQIVEPRVSRDVFDFAVKTEEAATDQLTADEQANFEFVFTQDGVDAWEETQPELFAAFGSPEAGDFCTVAMQNAIVERGGATVDTLLEIGFVNRIGPGNTEHGSHFVQMGFE